MVAVWPIIDSGIFNFLRNMGDSVGISWMNTVAQRHLQTHRSELVHSFNSANALFRREYAVHAVDDTTRGATAGHPAGPCTHQHGAEQPGADYAYVDDFHELAHVAFFCILFAFLLKKPKPGGTPAAG